MSPAQAELSRPGTHSARRMAYRLATLTIAGSLLLGCGGENIQTSEKTYDLAIMNGRVMDPETGLDAVRNVGVLNGEIVSVSQQPIKGRKLIDATGLVVAPGFIDMHAHDHSDFTHRLHAQDGVTTALELEIGVYPVNKWYSRRIGNSAINFGASVSHGYARAIAFGIAEEGKLTGETHLDDQALEHDLGWRGNSTTPEQRQQMNELIRNGLTKGGIGIGYHLANTPGADHAEMMHFYEFSAKEKAPNFVHYRSIGQVTPLEGAREIIEGAQKTGAAIHVVHVNSSGLWQTREVLELLESGQKRGLDVSTEVYPYTGAHANLHSPIASKETLTRFKLEYSDLQLVSTGERLTEKTYDYYKKHDATGELIAHVMKQENIDLAVEHPITSIGSDGGAYVDGKGHPRGAGTFSRIFRQYVRERQTLSLMDAVKKVSYMPAKRLENFAPAMKRRGRIQEGAIADITIFDANQIADQATFSDGALPSKGIAYVIVNGQAVVSDYKFIEGVKPGQPIYGNKAEQP